ncbi:hypothetical protein [Amycolatopsis sp. PS_44_ISF1]|uniref:hypothetical protein n=1 Tax=Amycolatopsis sp. PS_44_ISF1 TaxID=2974917 RepID=UPI0028DEA46B|nr:hypothetical protein [Amycolatopsis sp. PS_44_ISF1]MDT8912735.1 hypothetical protein [Amycolatopsis sp. PS_44_ISF1]
MSLTSELADPAGALTSWCARVFTGTSAVAAEVARAVRSVEPVRPAGRDVPRRHWAEIGGAFGQRLADLVQPAPPYYALLGLVGAQWVTGAWAHRQAAAYPTHRGLPGEYRARALFVRPAATTWLDLGDPFPPAGPAPDTEELWGSLLDRSRDYLAEHAPPGTLATAGAEAGLARTNWLLSACEDIYRSSAIDPRLARAVDGEAGGMGIDAGVGLLRGLAGEDQVAELVRLARRLHERGTSWELRALAGHPPEGHQLGIAGPTIVPGWADGDLLLGAIDPETGVDERGTTLVDVKTVVTVRDPDRVGRWLWQILLYAWLDTRGAYDIRRTGLLLARHGELITWPVGELAAKLLGGPETVEYRRDEARGIVGRILASAGLELPPY